MSGRQSRAAAEPLRDIERAELARSYDDSLGAFLDSESPAIAARAALAIGRTNDVKGAPVLREHLATSVPGVRAMCAYALGLLDDLDSLEALRALARHDTNSAVRYAAIDAVGRIALARPAAATRAVARDTIVVARTDRDAVVRAHAAAQLDAFKDPRFASSLARSLQEALARERDETVRWHLAWALYRGFAKYADPSFLRRSLYDRNELVRVEIARAWGRRTDRDATRIVSGALRDPSWRVQFEAREALRRIAKLPATEHLLADPPGIHLPKIPPPPILPLQLPPLATPTPTSRASASSVATVPASGPTGAALPSPVVSGLPKLAAPDPETLKLVPLPLATNARDLAAPAPRPHPRVRIATTKGDVVLRLYPEWAPSTVANFLNLTDRKYFDGNRWFRIVPDFVVQTGDPNDDGDGDAGYMIPAEENPLEQRAGAVAMGLNYDLHGAQRDSAGTQFYIDLSPQLHLDRAFSVFGEVESGFGVLAHLVESDRMIVVTRIADD